MLASDNYAKIVIGDDDQTFAEIEPISPSTHQQGKPLPLSKSQLKQFGAIFQHVPSLASNLLVATSQTYVMRFPPEVVKGMADGSLKIMDAKTGGVRGIVVDAKNGEFFKHVSLHEAGHLQAIAATTITWQMLAMITAQHYLPEISSKLSYIQQGIDDIKEYMEAEDRGLLKSIVKQVDSITSSISFMDFDEQAHSSNVTTLDSIDRDCDKLARKYLSLMEQYIEKFEKQNFSDFAGAKFQEAVEKGLQYVKYAEIAIKSVFVQFISASLRLLIPGSQMRVSHLLNQLVEELNEWNELQKEFFPVFQDKILNTDSWLPVDSFMGLFGQEKPMAKARSEILKRAVARRDEAMDLYRELTTSIQAKVNEINQPTSYLGASKALLIDLDENYQVTQVLEYQAA